jgi:hypothetical protein
MFSPSASLHFIISYTLNNDFGLLILIIEVSGQLPPPPNSAGWMEVFGYDPTSGM